MEAGRTEVSEANRKGEQGPKVRLIRDEVVTR